MSTQAMKTFITADKFAVLGRVLTDPSRFDHKVLKWYTNRNYPVTPVRPDSKPTDKVDGLTILSDPLQLPDLSHTSISIIINPILGLPILRALFPSSDIITSSSSPRALWFQPGAESPEIIEYIKQRGLEDRVIFGGPCILIQGDELVNEFRREKGKM